MKQVLIDTGILYEIFLEESPLQRVVSDHLESTRFVINIHIVDEIFTLFRARKKDHIAFRILEPLLSEELFTMIPVLPVDIATAAVFLRKFHDKRLSFTDAVILAQASHHDFQIWTADQEMQKTGIAALFHE